MADYKAMYHALFAAVTDAVGILQAAQVETEALFINTTPYDAELGEPTGLPVHVDFGQKNKGNHNGK